MLREAQSSNAFASGAFAAFKRVFLPDHVSQDFLPKVADVCVKLPMSWKGNWMARATDDPSSLLRKRACKLPFFPFVVESVFESVCFAQKGKTYLFPTHFGRYSMVSVAKNPSHRKKAFPLKGPPAGCAVIGGRVCFVCRSPPNEPARVSFFLPTAESFGLAQRSSGVVRSALKLGGHLTMG